MGAVKDYYFDEITAWPEQPEPDYPTEGEWWAQENKDANWESSHNEPENDMHISALKESKYLKKTDVDPAIKVTILNLTQENLAMENQPEELKWVLHFQECKPMVLNSTNSQLIAMALNSEETDDWKGKQIVLFNDPSVSFGGQLTGGVRARGVQGSTTSVQSEDPGAGMESPF